MIEALALIAFLVMIVAAVVAPNPSAKETVVSHPAAKPEPATTPARA